MIMLYGICGVAAEHVPRVPPNQTGSSYNGDLLLFGRAQHIGFSAIFVGIFIEYQQSVLESLV